MGQLLHGAFLLVFLLVASSIIELIPLSALAAMLVFTGFRLASPKEFVHMYKIGTTEIIVFVTTLLAVLATDLIIGIGIGILCNYLLFIIGKVSISKLFTTNITSSSNELHLHGAYTFQLLRLKKQIDNALAESELVVLNFTQTTFLDHTTIAHLQALQKAAAVDGRTLEFSGLEELVPATSHEQSERSRKNG